MGNINGKIDKKNLYSVLLKNKDVCQLVPSELQPDQLKYLIDVSRPEMSEDELIDEFGKL